MTITNDLQDMMTDTLTWAKLTTRDRYGNPSFGTAHTYPCRLVRKNKLVRDKDQQQVASSAQAWIGPTLISGEPFPAVAPVDRVTLSDGTYPQILSTDVYQDEAGPSHCVVNFL
jgi:hypothetical protein